MDKILRTFPMRFNTKVSTLEERKDLDKITMDKMHGILTTYEMRIEVDQPSKKECALKDSKRTKEGKHTSKTSSSEESNEEEANFVKKVTRGSEKYEGELPFKCFNCGKIGHFSSKCPFAKSEDINEDKRIGRRKQKEKKLQRGGKDGNKNKSLYSREDSSFNEEDSNTDIDSKLDILLFMDLDNHNEILEQVEEDSSIEGKVNMEEELIIALSELKKIREKYA